jgi:hypothetical protein
MFRCNGKKTAALPEGIPSNIVAVPEDQLQKQNTKVDLEDPQHLETTQHALINKQDEYHSEDEKDEKVEDLKPELHIPIHGTID